MRQYLAHVGSGLLRGDATPGFYPVTTIGSFVTSMVSTDTPADILGIQTDDAGTSAIWQTVARPSGGATIGTNVAADVSSVVRNAAVAGVNAIPMALASAADGLLSLRPATESPI